MDEVMDFNDEVAPGIGVGKPRVNKHSLISFAVTYHKTAVVGAVAREDLRAAEIATMNPVFGCVGLAHGTAKLLAVADVS